MTELTLNLSRTINAPAEKVFNAWLDPEMLARFMLPAGGMSVPKAATNPVEGGRFDIIMLAGDQEMPHAGTYKKIDRHSQLVFTWESPVSVDDSTVTLDFEPVKDGTKLSLHQVKFADQKTRDNHKGGWTAILEKLDAAVC